MVRQLFRCAVRAQANYDSVVRLRLNAMLVMAALIGAVLRAQPPDRDGRHFRTGVELTLVNATVRDAQGRLVTGLPREAFDVYEDSELQRVTQFTNERVPVSLGVLLDTSDSMFGQRLKDARAAVEYFLFNLLEPTDEYFILSFNHAPHIVTPWTTTPDVVQRALGNLKAWGGTAVYDAVVASLPMFVKRGRERAALLVISDGADTASDAPLRSVNSALLRSDAFAYAIAVDSPERQPINTRVNPTALRAITDQSGGRTEVVHSSAEIADAAARIADELNHQYLLGYTSSHGADGQFHSIRVRMRDPDYKVRARNGYVATPVNKSS
jgi:Ca-activated chloride channel family protein